MALKDVAKAAKEKLITHGTPIGAVGLGSLGAASGWHTKKDPFGRPYTKKQRAFRAVGGAATGALYGSILGSLPNAIRETKRSASETLAESKRLRQAAILKRAKKHHMRVIEGGAETLRARPKTQLTVIDGGKTKTSMYRGFLDELALITGSYT